jgi:hypothetical protein
MLRKEVLRRGKDTRSGIWELLIHQVAVAGRVLDAETNRPIPDALVRISGNGHAMEKRSAADGHYHFMDVPNGSYTVSASVPGRGTRYAAAEGQVTVSRDPEENLKMQIMDLRIRPTRIVGRVTGRDDEPVLLAEVRVKGSGERTYSDADGQYKLLGIETSTGTRQVVVSAQGYQVASQELELREPGMAKSLDFRLDRNKNRS